MFHASADVPHVGECPTLRRVFHGDAPSRGQHRPSNPSLRGPNSLGNPSNPSSPRDLNPSSPRDPRDLSAPSDPNNLSLSSNRGLNPSSPRNNPGNLSSRSDYSSEASSFIPSSIRDLSRNEKLSLIVLRWLPSG